MDFKRRSGGVALKSKRARQSSRTIRVPGWLLELSRFVVELLSHRERLYRHCIAQGHTGRFQRKRGVAIALQISKKSAKATQGYSLCVAASRRAEYTARPNPRPRLSRGMACAAKAGAEPGGEVDPPLGTHAILTQLNVGDLNAGETVYQAGRTQKRKHSTLKHTTKYSK